MTWEYGEGYGTWKTIQPAPTLADLEKHWTKYGHDKRKDGHGKFYDIKYKSWKQAQEDALVEVALFFLDTSEVLSLLKHMGLAKKVIDQAKEALDGADDLREQGRRTQRDGVSRVDGAQPATVQEDGSRKRNSRSRSTRSR